MAGTGFTRRWRTIRVNDPAVATDWEIKAPGSAYWRVVSLNALLTSDANVANRRVAFQANNQSTAWYRQSVASVQLANNAVNYCGHTGASLGDGGNLFTFPLPVAGLLLLPGHRLQAVTALIQAGDQWSDITALVDEIPSDVPFVGDGIVAVSIDLEG